MSTLIKQRRIVPDTWRMLQAGAPLPAEGDVIVPLPVWREHREQIAQRSGRTGVLLESADDPGLLAAQPPLPALLAVHVPAFSDGRGYSTAALLRARYGFTGELRAVGDVLRDVLFELARCGFDAFALRADQDAQRALAAFNDFSEVYQAAVDRGPLFARRLAHDSQSEVSA